MALARDRGRHGSQGPEHSWTDDLPACHLSGVGVIPNRVYGPDGSARETHPYQDCSLRLRSEECCLYGVCRGFEGGRVSAFVSQRLAAELLLGQLSSSDSDSKVKTVLLQAFDVVERSYFESIDDSLAERADLQSRLPEDLSSFQVAQQYSQLVERLATVEREVAGGATAVVALILNNKLYIANVGTNRALLCRLAADSTLQVTQLSMDHHTQNEAELQRLGQLGLDVDRIRREGRLGHLSSARCIGDYRIKLGYKDIEVLSAATSEPVTAEPEIHGGTPLDDTVGFLLLVSDGLYLALDAAHGPGRANQELALMVARELGVRNSVEAVAQTVVKRVARLHQEAWATRGERAHACERHDDMTLLVRNLGFPLGGASGLGAATGTTTAVATSLGTGIPGPAAAVNPLSPGTRVYPVSVPYSSLAHEAAAATAAAAAAAAAATGKTSVTLSLVMPSQGQLVNGSVGGTGVVASGVVGGGALGVMEGGTGGSSSDDHTHGTLTNSPHTTLRSGGSTTRTRSSSSSSGGEGTLFQRPRASLAAPPDLDGRVEPYVDFSSFYRLWGAEHADSANMIATPTP